MILRTVYHLMGLVYIINYLLLYLPILLFGIIPHLGLKWLLGCLLLLLVINFYPGKKCTPVADYKLLGHIDYLGNTVIYLLQCDLSLLG